MRSLFYIALTAALPVYAQEGNPATAADYAALAQQFAQDAVLAHKPEDFYGACSNILEAVTLEPTNQDYLVTATSYLDLKTRYTSNKELEGYKFAEQAIELSNGDNANAYFHAAKALNYIGSPAKAYSFAQQALKLGGLSTQDEEAMQKIVTNSSPRKTILWNVLDLQEIKRDGLASGNAFFYYPVPPAFFINQTAEYQVFGALKWDAVESNGDTFLRIWPGLQEAIEIRIGVSRFRSYRKVVEDHSVPLPPEAAVFTNSTHFIDATAPEIQAAAKIVRRTNWVETIDAIRNFVYNGWNYVATGTSSQSSTVCLRTRTGMCEDEANLCVALARANGIPARMVHGCESFNENGKFTGLTTGHVWCEAYIPGTGWCEFVDDSVGLGGIPWFCIRWDWGDTEVMHRKKWGSTSSETLDLAIKPPLINEEMERTKYILWFGMTDKAINQIGTRWHMIKENWQ